MMEFERKQPWQGRYKLKSPKFHFPSKKMESFHMAKGLQPFLRANIFSTSKCKTSRILLRGRCNKGAERKLKTAHVFCCRPFHLKGFRAWLKELFWCIVRQFGLHQVTSQEFSLMESSFILSHGIRSREGSGFAFLPYVRRAMEEDFSKIVGLSITIWVFIILFLLLSSAIGKKAIPIHRNPKILQSSSALSIVLSGLKKT